MTRKDDKNKETAGDRIKRAGGRGAVEGGTRKPDRNKGETRLGNAAKGARQAATNQAINEVPGGKLLRKVFKKRS